LSLEFFSPLVSGEALRWIAQPFNLKVEVLDESKSIYFN
jgi:hypothetical protein